MADLSTKNASDSTKIVGSDGSGTETNFVNATANGGLHANLRDAAGTETGTTGNPLKTSVTDSALPAGAATAVKQDTGNTSLGSIDTKLTSQATAAKQDTGNASLGSIDTKLTSQATAANQATEIASLQIIDDIAHAQNAALSKGVPAMGQLDDTGTTAATEDAVAVARITPQRALHANLRNQAGTEIGTFTNPVRINPTGGTIQPVSAPDVIPATQNITALDAATTSLVGANGQVFYTLTPTAGSAASFALSGIQTVELQTAGLGSGSLVIEVSQDGGTFWFRPTTFQVGTANYANLFAAPFSATVNVAGFTNVRVRSITSWTGTATVTCVESQVGRTMVVTDSALPTGASTAANQATLITSIQILDDVPAAQNGAFVKGDTIMGQLDDTSTVAANEDAVAAVRITPQRAVHMNMRNQAGAEMGTTANPTKAQQSDGTDLQTITSNGDAHVVDGIRAGGVYGRVSIPTSGTPVEMKVGAGRLANRKLLQVYCNSTGLFWGLDNTVTTTSGTPLAMGQVLTFTIDPDSSTFQIWLVGNANTKTVQVTECP